MIALIWIPKICLISSAGGHHYQLKILTPLGGSYDVFWVTTRTGYASKADNRLLQTGSNSITFPLKMAVNLILSLRIFLKEKPDLVITTGTIVVLLMALLAKIFHKRVIFIGSFAGVYDRSRIGRLMDEEYLAAST